MIDFNGQTNADLERFIAEGKRMLAVEDARDHLIPFTRLTMPDPEHEDDCDYSMFTVKAHHQLIGESLEKVETGEIMRLAISIAPQHGKSELASRRFLAWFIARNPTKSIIFATYSDSFAKEFGGEVREITSSPAFKQVFPDFGWRKGSEAKDYMVTNKGGRIAFIGRGGAGTGKPADLIVIDDPLKNAEEAESEATRRKLHEWYAKVAYTRAKMTTPIVVIQTRWIEDDLIGRLADPEHPDRKRDLDGNIVEDDESKVWTLLNIPAVVKDPELAAVLGMTLEVPTNTKIIRQFGNEPMAALWPERFSLLHLASAASLNPVGFNALYMGKPTPDDGEFFKSTDIVEYDDINKLPKELRYYGASDHAISTNAQSDFSVIGCVGVDRNDDIWVLPDLLLAKIEGDESVEEVIDQIGRNKTLIWWMEDENISKALGPFIKKRMIERKIYGLIQPVRPSTDKRVRARSIQARMRMGKVHFPKFAPWYREARGQMLKFPYATHDDFVDWLAHIGLGMMSQVRASEDFEDKKVARVGSMAWLKAASIVENRRAKENSAYSYTGK